MQLARRTLGSRAPLDLGAGGVALALQLLNRLPVADAPVSGEERVRRSRRGSDDDVFGTAVVELRAYR